MKKIFSILALCSVAISSPAVAVSKSAPRDVKNREVDKDNSSMDQTSRATVSAASESLHRAIEQSDSLGRNTSLINAVNGGHLPPTPPQTTPGQPTWPSGRPIGPQLPQIPGVALPQTQVQSAPQTTTGQSHTHTTSEHVGDLFAKLEQPKGSSVNYPKAENIGSQQLSDIITQSNVSLPNSSPSDLDSNLRMRASQRNYWKAIQSPNLLNKRMIIETENRDGSSSQMIGTIRELTGDEANNPASKNKKVVITLDTSDGTIVDKIEIEIGLITAISAVPTLQTKATTPEIEYARRVPALISKLLGKQIKVSSIKNPTENYPVRVLARNFSREGQLLVELWSGTINELEESETTFIKQNSK